MSEGSVCVHRSEGEGPHAAARKEALGEKVGDAQQIQG